MELDTNYIEFILKLGREVPLEGALEPFMAHIKDKWPNVNKDTVKRDWKKARKAFQKAEADAEKGAKKDNKILIEQLVPSTELVDGPEIVDEMVRQYHKYIDIEEHEAYVACIWNITTYFADQLEICPILIFSSNTKRCGKTRALRLSKSFVYRMYPAANISVAAVARRIDRDKPTVVFDEADTKLKYDEEMRGILNCGYTRDAPYYERCTDKGELEVFDVFTPKMIALIGDMQETVQDRGITIPMDRRRKGKKISRLRAVRILDENKHIREKLYAWSLAQQIDWEYDFPDDKPHLDRMYDNFEPLFCVARSLGKPFELRLWQAFDAMTEHFENESDAEVLLRNLCDIYIHPEAGKRITEIVTQLNEHRDGHWKSKNRGQGVTEKEIRGYFKRWKIYFDNTKNKQYRITQFKDKFLSYDIEPEYYSKFFNDLDTPPIFLSEAGKNTDTPIPIPDHIPEATKMVDTVDNGQFCVKNELDKVGRMMTQLIYGPEIAESAKQALLFLTESTQTESLGTSIKLRTDYNASIGESEHIVDAGKMISVKKHNKPSKLSVKKQNLGEVSPIVYKIFETTSQICEFCNNVNQCGIDIETYSELPKNPDNKRIEYAVNPMTAKIRLIQLYDGLGTVYIIDTHITPLTDEIRQALGRIPGLVAHNMQFEHSFLTANGIKTAGDLDCTMLMAKLLQEPEVGLASLAEKYLTITLNKNYQRADWGGELTTNHYMYASWDAKITFELEQIFSKQIDEQGLWDAYDLLVEALPAVTALKLNGVPIDVRELDDYITRHETNYENLRIQMENLITHRTATGKPKLEPWLRETLTPEQLKEWPTTKTGKLQTGNKVLIAQQHPMAPLVKEYMNEKKRAESYGRKWRAWVNPETQRIHADFKLMGTKTGRLSCSEPNMQQPPKDTGMRKVFFAPDDFVLLQADLSQIEARMTAVESNCKAMLEMFEAGVDLYENIAAMVYGKPATEVSKHERRIIKSIVLASGYGIGFKKTYQNLKMNGVDVTLDFVQGCTQKFHQRFPEIRKTLQRFANEAELRGYFVTAHGLKRNVEWIHNEEEASTKSNAYTKALNHYIQGTAAAALLRAMIEVNQIDWMQVVVSLHDELLVLVKEEKQQEGAILLERCLREGILYYMPNLPTKNLLEVNVIKTWAEKED